MTLKFLIGTLDCLPEVILDIDEISNFLSKLKQDYNQYLHPDYLDELSSWSILRQDSNLVILNIWYQLNEMPTEKWTESSYQSDSSWLKLREKATEVKKTFIIDIVMNAIYDWGDSITDYEAYINSVSTFLESDLDLNRNAIELLLQKYNPENDGWKMQSIMTLSQVLIEDDQILKDVMDDLKIEIDEILKE
ncbi:MAG: hypothetical protein ACI9N1_000806 [Flavobacteriales bacterium]|jgi:hypothetical protein